MLSKKISIELMKHAFKAMKNSHSVHSKFRVGAALLTASGEIFIGTNVEFDAFSLTVCAERSALFNSVSHGLKKIRAIAIAADSIRFKYPCGLCRQALVEFNPRLEVILFNRNKKSKRFLIKEIIPDYFKL